MTIVFRLPDDCEDSEAKLILQIIEEEAGQSALIESEKTDGKHIVAVVPPAVLKVFITEDIEEADCVNDGVIVIVDDINHPWKPIPTKFIYNSWGKFDGAITCAPVLEPKLAGWSTKYVATHEEKMMLYQSRPSQYIDWVPKRQKMGEYKKCSPIRYLRTIRSVPITCQSHRESIVLNALPRDCIVKVSAMARFIEGSEVIIRVKLVGNSGSETERVQDINFGSDGWITFQVDPIGDSSHARSIKYCEWMATVTIIPPVFFVYPGPYKFNAWKCASGGSESIFSSLKKSKPQYRYFILKKGLLSYYESEGDYSAGAEAIKNRFIPVNIMDLELREIDENNTGIHAINKSCLKYLINTEGSEDLMLDKYKVIQLIWDPAKDSSSKGDVIKAAMTLVVEKEKSKMIENAFYSFGAITAKKKLIDEGYYC